MLPLAPQRHFWCCHRQTRLCPQPVVDCCLLSAVVCIRRCNCRCQRDIRRHFRHQCSLLCQYCLCLFGSPHLQARRRQQRTGAAVTMVKSCSGERLKRFILVHTLLNKEPSLVAGLSQQLLVGTGILLNHPESGGFRGKYRNFCPTGIPAKTSCDSKKNRNLRPLQNHVSVKKSSRKHRKKGILRNPGRNLKTGITNLAAPPIHSSSHHRVCRHLLFLHSPPTL